MRRNELRTAEGFLEELIRVNGDVDHWTILGIVTPTISEDGKTATCDKSKCTFERDADNLRFERGNFSHAFMWQRAGCCEDDFYGEMLFPINGEKYLLISFCC